ncbi:hypothetical protein CRENBAI_011374 [Crenichthys baileyi]|uniref:Uncharacterized protein n=1 Tax=Crenichthys baileyi TaxID=28760 RepID=A0AAV9SEA8_9TELE
MYTLWKPNPVNVSMGAFSYAMTQCVEPPSHSKAQCQKKPIPPPVSGLGEPRAPSLFCKKGGPGQYVSSQTFNVIIFRVRIGCQDLVSFRERADWILHCKQERCPVENSVLVLQPQRLETVKQLQIFVLLASLKQNYGPQEASSQKELKLLLMLTLRPQFGPSRAFTLHTKYSWKSNPSVMDGK